jgi:aminoglycoside/choline kinase family phosphotransferase
MKDDKTELVKQTRTLLEESEMDIDLDEDGLTLLPGGSDRRFYRLKGKEQLIIMVVPTAEEVKEYIRVQEHLLQCGVAVPEIYASSAEKKIVLMEDIGISSLCQIVPRAANQEAVEKLYERVLDSLIHLQISGNEGIEKCKPVFRRIFDKKVLRWESDYFRRSFLEELCGCPKKETERLEKDFQELANLLDDEPLYFMHRDFQSTNIFIKDERVRIIDFQSAHRGMLSYDLAALLRDAYVTLPEKTRRKLFHYYYALLKQHTDAYRSEKDFRKVYVLSAIQRNMQALGAFSFLSMVKGKKWFLRAVPGALAYLQEGLDEAGGFKALRNTVHSARISECVQSMSS